MNFYDSENIIVGRAEMLYDKRKKAWIALGGMPIKDRLEAVKYACLMADYMQLSSQRKANEAKRNVRN